MSFVHIAEGPEPMGDNGLRTRIEALLAEPGHITRAEIRAALDDTE